LSTGNAEVVRRFYAAYNARDEAAWASLIADEFEFRSAFVGVEGRVYEGPTGFPRYFADLEEAWEFFWLELQDVLEANPDRVLGLMQVHGRGKTSGVEIDPCIAAVFRLRDGKVVGLETFMDPAEARKAVGLPAA
jgi:ketosteroid isomerase-like protein